MWNNTIGEHIRRGNRNLYIWGMVFLVAVAGAATLSMGYLRNVILGAEAVTDKDLLAKDAADRSHYYVSFTSSDVRETGLQQVETRKQKYTNTVTSTKVTANYLAAPVGDPAENRFLVIKAEPGQTTGTFKGPLRKLPADVQSNLSQGGVTLLPVMLDATDSFRVPFFICVPIALILAAIGVYMVRASSQRSGDFALHPIGEILARHGKPEEVAERMEAELKPGAGSVRVKDVVISNSWLLRPTTFGADIAAIRDIIWIHKKVTKTKAYGVVTTNTSYEAVLRARDGTSIEISLGEEDADRCLGHVAQRAPWAIVGYDAQIESLWNGSRAELVAAVDARREEIESQVGEATARPTPGSETIKVTPVKPPAGRTPRG